MFLRTFDISDSWVRTAVKKLGDGHTISPDKRGRHSKVSPALKKQREDNVMEHIKLFKPVPSHFCRANSSRQYLDSSLNIRAMYKLYKKWMAEKGNTSVVSEKYYRLVFCTKFNIGFYKPKKDQCDQCAVYAASYTLQRMKLQKNYDAHIANKKAARAQKDIDKAYAKDNKATTCYAIFDLQKVLMTPKLEVGSVYYIRKLSVYNFTIYEGTLHKGYCFIWNEAEASRGANEIASCLLNFISKKLEEGMKEFLFWSDNCAGQNKNMYLFAMYTYACAKFKIKISHKYLERGHTQNEADSVHAAIDRAAKFEKIYDQNDWSECIGKAKKEGAKYDIILIGSDVLNFHTLAKDCQNWKKPNAKWKQVREILVDSSNVGQVSLKHDLTKQDYIIITINIRGRPVNLANYHFQKAYNGPIPLNNKKLQDLATLCNQLVIPSHKHEFYNSLLNFPRLGNPLVLLPEDNQTDNEDEPNEDNGGFLWGDENDDETDYEEELRSMEANRQD